MTLTSLRSIVLSAALCLLAFAGCAGSTTRGVDARLQAPATGQPPAFSLPALNSLRLPSVATDYERNGSDYTDSSGAAPSTTHAMLTPPAGGIAWSLYPWDTQGDPVLALTVLQTPGAQTQVWVAVSDFGNNNWALYGPYSGQADIDLSGGTFINGANALFACVVAYAAPGSSPAPVDVELLSLQLDSAPSTGVISGQVTGGSPSGGLAGITVELYQGANLVTSVQTDGSGNYSFSGLPMDVYTVQPQSSDDCDPDMIPVNLGASDITGVDFNINPYLFLSGTILDESLQPMAGVQVDITGETNSFTTTDALGQYSFDAPGSDLSQGDGYSLSASLSGYTFTPDSISGLMPAVDVTDADFSGSVDTSPTYTVSGRIADGQDNGIQGLTVDLTGQPLQVTDANGNFSFPGVLDGDYTCTPQTIYCTPVSAPVTVAGADETGVNFLYTPPGYTVSGTIVDSGDQPVQGISVSLTGHGTVSTDASGVYTFTDIPDGDYTIDPQQTTTPDTRSITVNGADSTGNDFVTVDAGGHLVYGYIKDGVGNGVQWFHVQLQSGFGEVVTDANGYYQFSNIPDGNYRVQPITGLTSPPFKDITVSGADYAVPDFSYSGPPPPPG